ncbi:MAG: cation diffusion facilitator family transporter [Solirubrobacteraceae bacterium]
MAAPHTPELPGAPATPPTHAQSAPHTHSHLHLHGRDADRRALKQALGLILALMGAEVLAGLLARSLALLSDAAHMLTDAAALAIALAAAGLAHRPARGAMTFGLGRAEILSALANGVTLLLLGLLILYESIVRLATPPRVHGWPVLGVALAGVAVNLVVARILAGSSDEPRGLNIEGSYRHILTDLFGFAATALAAATILLTGFNRADAIASLLISLSMLYAGGGLLKASARVFMEAAPADLDPQAIGVLLASQRGVVEVHDLHVWEVTSGFPALSAHVVVGAGVDCHDLRRSLQELLRHDLGVTHTTLQVDHEAAAQAPLQIELTPATVSHPASAQPIAPSRTIEPGGLGDHRR